MDGGFDKRSLRTLGTARRALVGLPIAEAFAQRLGKLGPELARAHGAKVASAYWPLPAEVPTRPLLAALHAAGFAVVLPVSGARATRLTFRRWTPGAPMRAGLMGISEPLAEAEPLDPDILFVPLVAFDRRGHRLGYGGGFYDATLAALRAERDVVAVGLAYADQEVLFIPDEDHDEPLDFVMTEKDTIVCAETR